MTYKRYKAAPKSYRKTFAEQPIIYSKIAFLIKNNLIPNFAIGVCSAPMGNRLKIIQKSILNDNANSQIDLHFHDTKPPFI